MSIESTGPSGPLLIRGGHVVDPASGTDEVRDVLVVDGRVAGHRDDELPPGTTQIPAEGAYVLPGLVDAHVHLVDLARPGKRRTSAYERLARAGVTTAVEFFDFAAALDQWTASTAGLTMLGLQGIRSHDGSAPASVVRDEVATALRRGAIGVKLLGGHFPNTPDTTARVIEEADSLGAYCASHAGTTRHGSNLDGLREVLELADGRPLHVAHTNAYLRGATTTVDDENRQALDMLRTARRVVSEAHLAEFNVCLGSVTGAELDDHIARNCLRLGGFSADAHGLEKAFTAGFAHVLQDDGTEPSHVTGERALLLWRERPSETLLNFPVNNRLSALLQSCARVGPDGGMRWDGEGEFIVDAIASDGGDWRNVSLRNGFALVLFGALTPSQLARKACLEPARLFGLDRKGHLGPGADGDVVVVEPSSGRVRCTIAGGRVVFDGDRVVTGGGKVLTTAAGIDSVRERGIAVEIVDLETGTFRTRTSRFRP
jgi:hypothetical protein